MVVTEPRFFSSRPQEPRPVTFWSSAAVPPVPPSVRFWPVALRNGMGCVVVSLLLPPPLPTGQHGFPRNSPFPVTFPATNTLPHGQRRPSPRTSPSLSRPSVFLPLFLPPCARIQSPTHRPRSRAGIPQCVYRPRFCIDIIKTL